MTCDIAYSAIGELPTGSKLEYTRGVLSASVTADNEIRFDHPVFGQDGLLVPNKQLPNLIDNEMMVVRVPLGALDEQPAIRLTPPPVSNPSVKRWTCNDVARERRLVDLGWRKP